ncbi:unnamed protein product [Rotaria magnacalcarata]|uniref:Uncharacterized protein n=1 Tax=Rotaria magnacalcarata TaxID=392030 RepID=A0A814Z6M8_9BILA|nr:unnamed protein product [Rotaria magnacalcarata]
MLHAAETTPIDKKKRLFVSYRWVYLHNNMQIFLRLVNSLIDPVEPGNKDFSDIDDLINKTSKKITTKRIFDEK